MAAEEGEKFLLVLPGSLCSDPYGNSRTLLQATDCQDCASPQLGRPRDLQSAVVNVKEILMEEVLGPNHPKTQEIRDRVSNMRDKLTGRSK